MAKYLYSFDFFSYEKCHFTHMMKFNQPSAIFLRVLFIHRTVTLNLRKSMYLNHFNVHFQHQSIINGLKYFKILLLHIFLHLKKKCYEMDMIYTVLN